jgi:hypothetical protein
MGSIACSAQDARIPFRQIERDAHFSASAGVPANEAAVNRSYEMSPGSSTSAGFVLPPPVYRPPRTLTSSFFLMNGLHLGMAALDVATTQHCLADHHCREGNPLMPSSVAGQLSIDLAFVGSGTIISYKLKKEESRGWWLSPLIGVIAHTAGVASGLVNY